MADEVLLRDFRYKADGLSHQADEIPQGQDLIQVFMGQELIEFGMGMLIKEKTHTIMKPELQGLS